MSKEGYEITFAAAGDSMISRRISVFEEEEFLHLINRIREADFGFTNLEILLHNYEDYPAGREGVGTYMAAEPYMVQELKWAGFDVVSCANNHAGDYSYGGLLSTIRALNAAGMPNSGGGYNLAEARVPAYLETKKGRVALVSLTSSFTPMMRAGEARPDCRGRPGINGLRFETTYLVDRDSAENLRRILQRIGLKVGENQDSFVALGKRFEISDHLGVRMVVNEQDVQSNLRSIKEAKRNADWVFVSFHTHEGKGLESGAGTPDPAEFNVEFARTCIDAGAAGFFGHGPHVPRGIEIYHGKPIFYSLGNFIGQNETIKRQPSDIYEKFGLGWESTPADVFDARLSRGGVLSQQRAGLAWWSSFVAIGTLTEGNLSDLRLYPITLRHTLPRCQRGRPLLATGKEAEAILQGLQSMSSSFGVKIDIKEGIGEVKLN